MSADPRRVQRQRTKGWRMPEGAIYVGRPSKWGNPYSLEMMRNHVERWADVEPGLMAGINVCDLAVDAFRSDLTYGPDSHWWWYGPHVQILGIKIALGSGVLRGHDLVCWCPLDAPCHADVLLELANGARDAW